MNNYDLYASKWHKLNAEGKSLRSIGRHYGVSHKIVARILRKHQLPVRIGHSAEFKDISNQQFGLITAVEVLEKTCAKGSYYWRCYCACDPNKPLSILGSDLRRGRKTHCGCNFPMKFDIGGKKYGYLTAIKDSGERRSGGVMWECKCVCLNTSLVSYGDLTSGHTKSCGCKHRRSGEDHHNWSGSSEVKRYLRNYLGTWRSESLEYYSGRCVITGTEKKIEVHHLNKSFIEIFKEALEFHDLPELSSVGAYTSEQLGQLKDKVISLHFKYGLGVPINHKLHKEFHTLYGHNATPLHFDEFVSLKETKLNFISPFRKVYSASSH